MKGLHGTVQRVLMGYRSAAALRQAILTIDPHFISADWYPELRERITNHLNGEFDHFLDVKVADLWSTPFQRDVVQTLRLIPAGQTTSYGDLARKVGRTGAARAVGQVMATNPVPLIVPCHRVLGSGGRLGGFSAPTGTVLKQQLLDLEAGCLVNA
ncbi:methylated-DNA--[protein]-cysteine S-methyltransferase [bacterium]|nr:methylated-DNA--[protein]-cysteine S-methyltransferase [bacterium]